MNVFSVVRNIVYIYLLIVNLFLHIIYIIEYIQAIQQGNSEGARIYAQDAIREKNQVRVVLEVEVGMRIYVSFILYKYDNTLTITNIPTQNIKVTKLSPISITNRRSILPSRNSRTYEHSHQINEGCSKRYGQRTSKHGCG